MYLKEKKKKTTTTALSTFSLQMIPQFLLKEKKKKKKNTIVCTHFFRAHTRCDDGLLLHYNVFSSICLFFWLLLFFVYKFVFGTE